MPATLELDKQARPQFRFGVPSDQYLSFEGPGGNAASQGALSMKHTSFHSTVVSHAVHQQGGYMLGVTVHLR